MINFITNIVDNQTKYSNFCNNQSKKLLIINLDFTRRQIKSNSIMLKMTFMRTITKRFIGR